MGSINHLKMNVHLLGIGALTYSILYPWCIREGELPPAVRTWIPTPQVRSPDTIQVTAVWDAFDWGLAFHPVNFLQISVIVILWGLGLWAASMDDPKPKLEKEPDPDWL